MSENLSKKEIAKQYIKASVHYGHAPKEWNPKMAPYILCAKYGYHIFDLVKTSKLLKLAGNVLEKNAEKGGKFLFVGTNKLSSSIISKQAKRAESYYINYRWLGGMLTNWSTVQMQIQRLKELEKEETEGNFEFLSKKDYSSKRKDLDKLRTKAKLSLEDLKTAAKKLAIDARVQSDIRLNNRNGYEIE
jgi:small subunit ribosomal protein S2